MGSIIASCCGSLFAGLCCGACAQCKPAKSGPTSRIPYLFILILSGVFATIMSVYGEKHWLDTDYVSINCHGCKGNGSVFRVSFCLFLFELVHAVFIGLGAVSFHWLWFALKFMVYIGAVIITFFFGNNSMYSNFGQFSRYCASPIYLLLQILILINCGYILNETLQRKGATRKFYLWLLVGGTCLFYAVAIVLLGISYKYYAGVKCNTHNAIITISFVGVGLNCGLSIWLGKGNFFVSSIVSLYMAYLTVAGLQSSTSCNSLSSSSDSYTWTWIGVCLALATLVYAGLRSNLLAEFFSSPEDYSDIEEPLLSKKKESTKDLETNKVVEDEDEDNDKSNYDDDNEKIKESNYNDPELESNNGEANESKIPMSLRKEATSFHVIMTLAAAYMSMLLTNWGTAHGNISTAGTASMWANIACCWATGLLFYWTLLAPVCCPSRFESEDDDDE